MVPCTRLWIRPQGMGHDMPCGVHFPFILALFFALSIYFAFGMMEKLPVKFLPFFQIREVVSNSGSVFPMAILTAMVWTVLLLVISGLAVVKLLADKLNGQVIATRSADIVSIAVTLP